MAPPMPNPVKRFTANPAKPARRYRPGKAIPEYDSSDEEETDEEQPIQKSSRGKSQPTQSHPGRVHLQRKDESEDEDEGSFITDEEDATDGVAPTNSQLPQQTTAIRSRSTSALSDADSNEPESENDRSGEGSSDQEDESSEEDETPRRKFQRPTFIRKSDRHQSSAHPVPTTEANSSHTLVPNVGADPQNRRLAQAELLIKDKLERDAVARAQGKKDWDDDDETIPGSMVNDIDGVDPEAEYAAWKLRELKRLKRDREALIAREKEIEEIERRRNLTAEEREMEDSVYLEKQKADREQIRHEASYLARYHHKGAFLQGDEAAELLKRRDVMGARFEDQVSDKSVLPEYMRIRDMTKLGKKGRTRYTDMKNEDTGRFGEEVKRWQGSGGGSREARQGDIDMRHMDDRFLPDDRRGGNAGPTGANASVVASGRERSRADNVTGDAARDLKDTNGFSYRPSDRDRTSNHRHGQDRSKDRQKDGRKRSYSRSRSRSGSPRRRKRNDPNEHGWRHQDEEQRRGGVRA